MASKQTTKPTTSKTAIARRAQPQEAFVSAGYGELLADLKVRIRAAQARAALSVNRELIQLYWDIGREIVRRQDQAGWGAGVINQLAHDLQAEFPGQQGLSSSNLSRMRAFYLAYSGGPISARAVPKLTRRNSARAVPKSAACSLPSPLAQIPWGHNVVLLFKVKTMEERLWYAQQAVEHGWSRAMLMHWIESDLYARQGKAITNFKTALPAPQSDLAQQLLKDPYNFDFLTLYADAQERELEHGLLDHVRKFLLELGAGFAFVGQQVPLEVDGENFTLDLLFYHLRLRAFVVIDLKAGRFKPEFAGALRRRRSTSQPRVASPRAHPGNNGGIKFLNTPKGFHNSRRPSVKPFQGLAGGEPTATQGALADSRPWAELYNRFAVKSLPASVKKRRRTARSHGRFPTYHSPSIAQVEAELEKLSRSETTEGDDGK